MEGGGAEAIKINIYDHVLILFCSRICAVFVLAIAIPEYMYACEMFINLKGE